MKMFLSTLKFTNNCKVFKKTVFLSILSRRKNIKKLGQKLSKLPAGKKNYNFIRVFRKTTRAWQFEIVKYVNKKY